MSSHDWTVGEEEVYAFENAQNFFDSEVGSYDRLGWLQGQNVPLVFGTAALSTATHNSEKHRKFFEVPMALMEYVQGFCLADLVGRRPNFDIGAR